MNRHWNKGQWNLLLVLPLLASLNSFSSSDSKKEIHSILTYKTNLGFEQTASFTIKNGILHLPGKEVSLLGAVPRLNTISIALSMGKDSNVSEACAAGQYLHGVSIDNQKRVEKGCLDDPRFSRLSAAFSALEKL